MRSNTPPETLPLPIASAPSQVSCLMPPPYSFQHNTYLKRYMSTGSAHILMIPQRLEGRHRRGHNFRIVLTVNKVEAAGEVRCKARTPTRHSVDRLSAVRSPVDFAR